jgi:glutamate 5-kinase
VIIDNGAKAALLEKHSSLLPSGIISISGRFHAGDVVKIVDSEGNELAVGKVRYSSDELDRIKQKKSSAIAEILGRKESSFVIHCDEIGFY